jgi:diguanylate cyclase (GGDEF)-like protein
MDRWLALLRINSSRQVLWGTAAITAIAVAAPVLTFAVVLFFWTRVPLGGALAILAICATIPLLIAPPISFFALSVLRLLTVTIERVDAYVRFDTLTGVLTRAYLLGQMRDQLKAAGSGAFLMVDADHFKKINDTYGHDVGDEALKRLAEVLRTTLTVDALVGRLGGEEFGVFLPGAGDEEAAAAALSLCEAMRVRGKVIAGHELAMTISVGGATHRSENTIEATMKLADAALYHAKRSGRDRFFIAAATDTMPALILRANG